MQRVLSNGLWKELKAHAKGAKRRKAAIAYVTKDLIGFKKGDVLVTDASTLAIRNGETNARFLRHLHRRGIRIHSCGDLHAKVLLLDEVAVVGSGNMSNSSAVNLVEAALITDHTSTVAGVASLIEQLVQQSDELQPQQIAALCRIKVLRRGGRPGGGRRRRTKVSQLGNRTWLVGVRELVKVPPPADQWAIERAKQLLAKRLGVDWEYCGKYRVESSTFNLRERELHKERTTNRDAAVAMVLFLEKEN